MYFGGDYNPEQWPEEVWDEDVRLMREARVNLVSVGIFAWARLQPDEGEFDFAWLDRLLDKLHDGGISVDLATATASPPNWLVRRYPDVLPVTETGTVLGPGSRQHYAPTSPDYRRLAADLVTALGRRYADHPAVAMWHINNEYACHVRADYSEHAALAFRSWLSVHYGDIDSLNDAWGTAFWSQHYNGFDEVRPPRASPTTQNPSLVLDWRRFTSDSVLDLYRMERDALRAAGAEQPVTTNFMGAFPAMNYWDWAAEVDVVSHDGYPDPRDSDAHRHAAFAADLMRSLKPDRPWLLMEQAPNAVQWRPNNAAKAPGQMAAWSEQAVARGADSVLYFQWRQSRSGAEKFHSAMLPHSGKRSRTWKEISQLGAALEGREPASPPPGDVAIVFDWENRWALTQPDLPADIDYQAEVFAWYEALHARHVQVSFVRAESDLSGFRLVVAPALYLLTEDGAASLERFVETGGTLVTTAFTDIVDEHDRFRPGGYGTQLGEVLGGRPVDFFGVLPEEGRSARASGADFAVTTMIEDFDLDGGDVLARTAEGEPVLIRNRFGAGTSLHLACFTDKAGTGFVLDHALEAATVTPVVDGLDPAVEAVATLHGATLINQSANPVKVKTENDAFTMAPFEVRHITRDQLHQ
ncbi:MULTISPECIES: beta-galactosidase [Glycomyces]|uniref:Beta-galactosidase n=2 Tax=Glycomyces TaxID=58113 RepID=A0A9X3SYB7_9ACTN|nr:beta-galactosidase [Glycomyces lechevalierae]MDA1386086.1 beta-galactosidase [Glycomyces lechevalierae]MDR7340756.1 beta-galactosidase [Glycomyces lechevalierae]